MINDVIFNVKKKDFKKYNTDKVLFVFAIAIILVVIFLNVFSFLVS